MTDRRTILDSADAFDADLMGLDGPVEYSEGNGGLRVTQSLDGWVYINGPDGEIEISPCQVAMVAWAINTAKARNESRGL